MSAVVTFVNEYINHINIRGKKVTVFFPESRWWLDLLWCDRWTIDFTNWDLQNVVWGTCSKRVQWCHFDKLHKSHTSFCIIRPVPIHIKLLSSVSRYVKAMHAYLLKWCWGKYVAQGITRNTKKQSLAIHLILTVYSSQYVYVWIISITRRHIVT